ncbi:VtaA18 [Sarcoptes scabiei]|nr:VtaA18 [Sarcoptes scabiei]
MLINIRNFTFRQLKEIHDERLTWSYVIKHGIDVLLLVIFIIRCIVALICMRTGIFNYWDYDPFFYYIVKINFDLALEFLCTILFTSMLSLHGKLTLFFVVPDYFTHIYKIAIDHIENRKKNSCYDSIHGLRRYRLMIMSLFQHKKSSSSSTSLPSPPPLSIRASSAIDSLSPKIIEIKSRKKFSIIPPFEDSLTLKKINKLISKLKSKPNASNFEALFRPNLSIDKIFNKSYLYKKIDNLSRIVDSTIFTFHILAGVAILTIGKNFFKLEMYSFFLLLLDYISLTIIVSAAIQVAFLVIITNALDSFWNQANLNFFIERFDHISKRFRPKSIHLFRLYHCNDSSDYQARSHFGFVGMRRKILRDLTQIYRDYSQHISYIKWTFEKHQARILGIYCLFSIPSNVITFLTLIYKEKEWVDVLIFIMILLLHAGLTMSVFVTLAHTTKLTIEPSKSLMSTIQSINCHQNMILKMKLDDLFAYLMEKKVNNYNPSVMGEITFYFIFKILLVYAALFLCALSHISIFS